MAWPVPPPSACLACRTDAEWHHIAVSWVQSTGETRLFFDAKFVKPYMRQDGSILEVKSPNAGGADPHIAAGTLRRSEGVLMQRIAISCQQIWQSHMLPVLTSPFQRIPGWANHCTNTAAALLQ